METTYVHGYSADEARRLNDQADTLANLLHAGTSYPPGSRVLEIGCGVGAQTAHLVASSPGARLVAIDRSAESLETARRRMPGVEWHQADVFDMPFADEEFDHVFVCFVLEHLRDPSGALAALRRVLKPGGTITVIEGDHASAFFHPDSELARATIAHQIRLQAVAGGNALLGRQLYPLLREAEFEHVAVEPICVYADESRPDLVKGFTRNTFIALFEAAGDEAVAAGLTGRGEWQQGITDLRRIAQPGGTLHYTFFKALATKGNSP
ncbi:methyltransferase domain-containing protein [Kribbella deserti]|uniref:Methyltransferase domain-containing protein n=1 Tax=Kribbella deserti TaxID=1926257 RepID=A0ABV6QPT7_9ACTN